MYKLCLKIRTFKPTIEPILLYDSEYWTIDSTIRKQIDGCYTRLLRMATNICHEKIRSLIHMCVATIQRNFKYL